MLSPADDPAGVARAGRDRLLGDGLTPHPVSRHVMPSQRRRGHELAVLGLDGGVVRGIARGQKEEEEGREKEMEAEGRRRHFGEAGWRKWQHVKKTELELLSLPRMVQKVQHGDDFVAVGEGRRITCKKNKGKRVITKFKF